MEHESDSDTNSNWCTWHSHQRIGTGPGGLGNKMMGVDCPNYCIIEISQNTKMSPGDLRGLTVTQNSCIKSSVNAGVKKLSNE